MGKSMGTGDTSGRVSSQAERRGSRRYNVERDIHYRIVAGGAFEGIGKTVNMSGNGMLLITDRVLSPGWRLEVEVDWPRRAAGQGSVKLFVKGSVVRSKKNHVAIAGVKILRYNFQFLG
jgi:hypothetical protein